MSYKVRYQNLFKENSIESPLSAISQGDLDPCLLGVYTVARKKSNSYERDNDGEDDDVNSFVGDEIREDEIKKAKKGKQDNDDNDNSNGEGGHIYDYENGKIVC